tara:strand:- start:7852 stop:8955 length:1104 start_codon:yes stop_codon:yes gene_type:complete
MFSKINLYLAKNFFISFIIVLFIFSSLIIIGDFVEQFRKATGKDVPVKIIFQLSLLNFLSLLSFILPIVSFFGALFTFIYLIKRSELIIIGSIGLSTTRVLIPPIILYFFLGIFFVTIINPLSSAFHDKYTELEYKYIAKSDKFASITKNGLWLKQHNNKKKLSSVFFAKQISNNGKTLYDFMLLEYDQNGVFQGRLDGKKAVLLDNFWEMSEVQISPRYSSARYEKQMSYATNINQSDITDSLSSPNSISFWRMGKFINFLEDLGYSAREFKMHYYNLLTMPLLISCLVILSASIVSTLKQNERYTKQVVISLLLIFFVYFISNLFDALGSTDQISPFVSKIITPIIIIVVSIVFFQISFVRKNKL